MRSNNVKLVNLSQPEDLTQSISRWQDMVLITRDRELQAHKAVLLTKVPELQDFVCTCCLSNHEKVTILLPEVNTDLLELALHSAYFKNQCLLLRMLLGIQKLTAQGLYSAIENAKKKSEDNQTELEETSNDNDGILNSNHDDNGNVEISEQIIINNEEYTEPLPPTTDFGGSGLALVRLEDLLSESIDNGGREQTEVQHQDTDPLGLQKENAVEKLDRNLGGGVSRKRNKISTSEEEETGMERGKKSQKTRVRKKKEKKIKSKAFLDSESNESDAAVFRNKIKSKAYLDSESNDSEAVLRTKRNSCESGAGLESEGGITRISIDSDSDSGGIRRISMGWESRSRSGTCESRCESRSSRRQCPRTASISRTVSRSRSKSSSRSKSKSRSRSKSSSRSDLSRAMPRSRSRSVSRRSDSVKSDSPYTQRPMSRSGSPAS